MSSDHPVFYANKIGGVLRVARMDDFPDGTRPEDALGLGTVTIKAPDSERARSYLGALRSADES